MSFSRNVTHRQHCSSKTNLYAIFFLTIVLLDFVSIQFSNTPTVYYFIRAIKHRKSFVFVNILNAFTSCFCMKSYFSFHNLMFCYLVLSNTGYNKVIVRRNFNKENVPFQLVDNIIDVVI